MPKARVLFTSYGYRVGDDTLYAREGSVIDVSQEELDRGLGIGGLEKVSTKKAAADPPADPNAPPPPPKLLGKAALVEAGKQLDPPLDLSEKSKQQDLAKAITDAGGNPFEPTTPAGDPTGDGKHDQDA